MPIYIWAFGVALIVALIATPAVILLAEKTGAMDAPNARKVHKKPMPLMGGLMIFFGFLFGYMLFAPQSTQMLAILIGSFIVIITGILDVIKPINRISK